VRNPEIVIFEGILALYDEKMRDLFDLKVFVDVDADVRLARRIKRDMVSRGRSLDGVLQQYERFVKPATEQFVLPTKRYADIVIPNGVENAVGIDIVAQHINGVLMRRELMQETVEGLSFQTDGPLELSPTSLIRPGRWQGGKQQQQSRQVSGMENTAV
jgi:uridine kinase